MVVKLALNLPKSKCTTILSKADYLLISGKSVRLDQPILDTRFATLESKHTPDVLILTREQNFPHNAPLFNVPCRNVEILHHLDFLQPYDLNLESQKLGFIFCEGSRAIGHLKPLHRYASCDSQSKLLRQCYPHNAPQSIILSYS